MQENCKRYIVLNQPDTVQFSADIHNHYDKKHYNDSMQAETGLTMNLK